MEYIAEFIFEVVGELLFGSVGALAISLVTKRNFAVRATAEEYPRLSKLVGLILFGLVIALVVFMAS